MGITIRDADLDSDREEIIRFLHENLTPDSDEFRFDWLYLANPHGCARVWMAVDGSGRTVGISAAFPRYFSVAGESRRTWVLGDFCIDKQYRSLGPALQLQRMSLETLAAEEYAICYDFPSPAMMSIYARLGVRALSTQVRHMKLLSTAGRVHKFVKQRFIADALSLIGDLVLRFRRRPQSLPEGVEFSMQECKFGEEIDAINFPSQSPHPVKALHSAKYLNWRYVDHPLKQYCAVAARRQSGLVGYGVVEIDGNHSTLADLRAMENENCLPGILAYVELLLREMNVYSISAPVLQGCHLVPHLRQAGFYPRESRPVVAYANSKAKWHTDIHDANNWMLLYGDRDS